MQGHRLGKSSRREFIRGSAALALTGPGFMSLGRPVLAYVGTYSSPQGPEGAIGRGQGIYLFEMNAATGALRQRDVFPSDSNPSWLALNPSRTYLYSANEISNYKGTNSGSVSAYSIDRPTGRITILNTVSSEGAGPAHLSVHPSGKYVFVANYHGGTVAVFPVRPNGELGVATDVIHNSGTIGPIRGDLHLEVRCGEGQTLSSQSCQRTAASRRRAAPLRFSSQRAMVLLASRGGIDVGNVRL